MAKLHQGEPMLTQVADGVWVRQSEWVWTNSIAVRGEEGLILVDPGIDGSELNQLADDLDRLGIPVVAGVSTHPHWDHLLWHSRFGDVPRYATAAGAHRASEARARAQAMAAESASGIPLELIGLVTPLPADGGPVPGEIVEHQAHAVGHAAILLADRGVLLAGDMLSDVLIPLFDPRQPDQVGAYETALDRLGEAARDVDVVVPGHGSVAEGPDVAARLVADRAYIDALRRGEEPDDARLGAGADWLSGPHRSNLEQVRARQGLLTTRGSCRVCRPYDEAEARLVDAPGWGIANGAQDSTATLQLVWMMLKQLPRTERHKTVHVITTDTGVENPVVARWANTSLQRMSAAAVEQGLPIEPHRLTPDVGQTF